MRALVPELVQVPEQAAAVPLEEFQELVPVPERAREPEPVKASVSARVQGQVPEPVQERASV